MHIIKRSSNPFFHRGNNNIGILLIHGFTGTPSELIPLGDYLKDRGYTVNAPLLSGHGTTPEDMRATRWTDWWNSVLDGYDKLAASDIKNIYAIGLSMGGCFSLYLSLYRDVAGVVSMCAPVWIRDYKVKLVDWVRFFIPYVKRTVPKPEYVEQYLIPYDRTPLDCIVSLKSYLSSFRKSLSKINVPALILQSRNDESILPESAIYIYENISSSKKRLSWYERSGHIITVDRERDKLFSEINDFLSELTVNK